MTKVADAAVLTRDANYWRTVARDEGYDERFVSGALEAERKRLEAALDSLARQHAALAKLAARALGRVNEPKLYDEIRGRKGQRN